MIFIQHPEEQPCAGEGAIVRMLNSNFKIFKNDIDINFDNPYYLDAGKQWHPEWQNIKTVITNPPFNIALSVIINALEHVDFGGEVIMLLRLNFLGSQERKPFFNKYPPKEIFVLSQRPKFYNGKTDSIEYAWFVWQKGYKKKNVFLEVL